jgi:hypothetical protein
VFFAQIADFKPSKAQNRGVFQPFPVCFGSISRKIAVFAYRWIHGGFTADFRQFSGGFPCARGGFPAVFFRNLGKNS